MAEEIIKIVKAVGTKQKVFAFADVLNQLKHPVSRQYVSMILNQLVDKNKLSKVGYGRWTLYSLPSNRSALGNRISKHLKNIGLEEDKIFYEFEKEAIFWPKIKENIQSIIRYGFMEMVNNAIEHSISINLQVSLEKTQNQIKFIVSDSGIGVFRNIKQKRHLKSEFEAIQDLMKGKTTTAPKAHSGEGIFFTSKAADIFILESFDLRLTIDNNLDDIFVEELEPAQKGTKVTFIIDAESKKHLNNIFSRYQNEPESYAFDKTEVKIKLYTYGTIYISRSQARRVLYGLDKFKVIILDFEHVPTIGQAFADEIFRVFQNRHPDIKIEAVNMILPVEFMVKRVSKI